MSHKKQNPGEDKAEVEMGDTPLIPLERQRATAAAPEQRGPEQLATAWNRRSGAAEKSAIQDRYSEVLSALRM